MIIPRVAPDRQYARSSQSIHETTRAILSQQQRFNGFGTDTLKKQIISEYSLNAGTWNTLMVAPVINATAGLRACAEILWDLMGYRSVALPALSFHATALAFSTRNWDREFVDCDEFGVMNPDLVQIEPDVIVPVGLFGNSVEHAVSKIRALFPKTLVLEDAAQHYLSKDSHGNQKIHGDLFVMSFDPTKNISNPIGSGGAIVLNNNNSTFHYLEKVMGGIGGIDNLIEGFLNKIWHFQPVTSVAKEKIMLDDLSCALISDQYQYKNKDQKRRKKIFEHIKSTADKKGFRIPVNLDGFGYQKFPIFLGGTVPTFMAGNYRNSIGRFLRDYDAYNIKLTNTLQTEEDFDNTRLFEDRVFMVHFHQYLTDQEVEFIDNNLKNI